MAAQKLPSLTDAEDQPERLEPGDSRRRRPQARRRPRRPDGDHRQHAAARGGRRRRDLVLQGRARSSTRSRSACSRTSGATSREIGRLTVPSADRPGPHRQHRDASSAASGRATLQRSDRQFAVSLIADVAPGHALDEASNDVRTMLAGLNMPPTMSFRLQGQSKILDETTDQPDHGDRPGDDLRLHGAGVAVRELPPADRHHAGAADRRCRSRCSRCGSPGGR